jgi:hypothetical protein
MLWLEMDCSQLSGSGSCSLGSPNSYLSESMIPQHQQGSNGSRSSSSSQSQTASRQTDGEPMAA